jgi:hypothetical protein
LIALALALAGAALLALGPRRLWRFISRLYTFASMPVHSSPIESDGTYTNVIFLHHSTGQNLITEGDVRPQLSNLGYQFWDHGFNHTGLVRPDGAPTGTHYGIPGARGRGNTDVDGLASLFSQPVTDPPINAFSRLLQHEVIIVKSCFPNSAIKSDETEEQFKTWYLQMRDAVDKNPDRVFIIMTSPPLHPQETSASEARRARAVADWLNSDDYLGERPNLFVFDFFDLLADKSSHVLREEYRRLPDEPDSHPNQAANETIGPLFVRFIDEAIQTYRSTQAGRD